MIRLLPLVAAVLLSGCGDGDPVANDPILKLNVKRGNSESIGRYRVSRTGVIDESRDSGPDGTRSSETVTIDKIAKDGVTVTIVISDADTGIASKQFLVPYDQEITATISEQATAKASLEHKQ